MSNHRHSTPALTALPSLSSPVKGLIAPRNPDEHCMHFVGHVDKPNNYTTGQANL